MPLFLVPLIDALLVVIFVALGRGKHEEGAAVSGTFIVAAPFLIALAVAWVVVLVARWRGDRRAADPFGRSVGLWCAGVTLVLGMVLRHTAFDRGTAIAFIIVAALFLHAFLVGWREGYRAIQARRTAG
jgi:hypothetical protein